MATLDLDPDGLDRVSSLIRSAGEVLAVGLDTDVPAVGGDEVSQHLMDNLNARRRWLLAHLASGHGQALDAADTVAGNAAGYRAQDHAAAGSYGGGSGGDTAGPVPAASSSAPAAPGAAPTPAEIPDISGRDGEEVAAAMERGAGPQSALAAAARLTELAGRAQVASTALAGAQAQLAGSGVSQVHAPLNARLTRALAWSQAVSDHAAQLAAGYSSAAGMHESAYAAVGPSAGWRALKTAYENAVAENVATGGLNQPMVDALSDALTEKQQLSAGAMTGYQDGGKAVSTSPATLPDPGLDPNGSGGTSDPNGKAGKAGLDGTKKGTGKDSGADSGAQDMLSPLLGAMGPLMQSVGKANPLQGLGQAAQQLGQQVSQQIGQLAKAGGSPIKPAALDGLHPAAGKGIGKGAGGGGGGKPLGVGSSIKGGAGIAGGTHPAATPGGGPAAEPSSGGASRGAGPSGSGGGGMGMMPHNRGADGKSIPVSAYPGNPLEEIETGATEGVAGETSKPAPIVSPEFKQATMDRIAKRKQAATASDDA